MSRVGDWKALGRAVTSRRVELGYDRRDDFAAMAGIGSRTVGEIERGEEKGYRDSLIAKLEKALQWPPGSTRTIVAGGEPPAPGSRTVYGDPDQASPFVISAPTDRGKSAVLAAVQAGLVDTRTDDPDPLSEKLHRLESYAAGLNPTDLRMLNGMIQIAVGWAFDRMGEPEPTSDEQASTEAIQRAARDLRRRQEAHARGEVPAETVEQRR
jgi:hypothetical protein